MTQRRTPLTVALIIANFAVFAWEYSTGALTNDAAGNRAMIADGAIVPALIVQNHEWWRIVAGAFLHASILHIAVNMISLWALGRFIEIILGSVRMGAVYIVSMLVSGLAVTFLPGDPYTPTVGASGAIFGLFGALFAIGFKLGPPGMQLIRSNIAILVINLIFTFSIPFISKWGHVGGLCAGFLLTLAIFFPPQPVRATVVDAQSGAELESELQAPDRSSGL